MATYAIGDLQGCHFSFQHLLSHIQFDPARDRLWLVGDLINRGGHSLQVLRWLHQHRQSIVAVLGNHDLHALAVAEGFVQPHRSDTLQEILDAPDRDDLLNWLRSLPLVHAEAEYLMVHAGLLPQWSATDALTLGAEVAEALRGPDYRDFLRHMYGNHPVAWDDSLHGMDRLRMITNAMTRLRICTLAGEMDFKFKSELDEIPAGYVPWFEVPQRRSADTAIVFGHWSALGLQQRDNLFALDTGCLWGGSLTAMRLEDRTIFQVPCSPEDSPRKIKPAGNRLPGL
ncbi:bis(5'nucleosyl)-tetraphosphatase ApaH [Methylovorus glucosotrophus]|uniref:symmetrical bis(5'-nucleosyl)-tetraphosphatase n=1 Tax=Methylovorus glucosotrophus TaxID=266009 RepID=UPI0013317CC7|nr:symmetrical bis(5'-nucleosyl)-tetraphosphatase [Methylovorus glucosotrophus]KAF0843247.1 bis(5'nucleosyl)-tetraphosphatase ApaH [Methylovorus glucosotrophus]